MQIFTVNYPTTWKFYWKSLDSTEFLPSLPNRWLFLVYLSFIHSSNNTVSKIAQVIEKSWYEGGPFFVILLYESINYRWCPLKMAAKNPRVWKDVYHSTVEFFSKSIFLSGRNCNGTTWIHLPWWWRETDCHSDKLIQSLRGLLDQLHICERVNFENSSLVDFKDLKLKLEYKLLKQTECILAKLHLDLWDITFQYFFTKPHLFKGWKQLYSG